MGVLDACEFPNTKPSLNCTSNALKDAGVAGIVAQALVVLVFVVASFYFLVEVVKHQQLLRNSRRGYQYAGIKWDWRTSTLVLAFLFSVFCVMGAIFGAYFVPETFALTAFFFCSAGSLGASGNFVACLTVYEVEPSLKTVREKRNLRISSFIVVFGLFLLYGPILIGVLVATDRMNFRDLTITSSAINIFQSCMCYYMSQRYAFKVVKVLEEDIKDRKIAMETSPSGRAEQIELAEATKEKMVKWVNGIKGITVPACLLSLTLVVPQVAEKTEVFIFYAFYIIFVFLANPLNIALLLRKVQYKPSGRSKGTVGSKLGSAGTNGGVNSSVSKLGASNTNLLRSGASV